MFSLMMLYNTAYAICILNPLSHSHFFFIIFIAWARERMSSPFFKQRQRQLFFANPIPRYPVAVVVAMFIPCMAVLYCVCTEKYKRRLAKWFIRLNRHVVCFETAAWTAVTRTDSFISIFSLSAPLVGVFVYLFGAAFFRPLTLSTFKYTAVQQNRTTGNFPNLLNCYQLTSHTQFMLHM